MFDRWLNKLLKKDFDVEAEGVTIHDYHLSMRLIFLGHGVGDGVDSTRTSWLLSLNMIFLLLTGLLEASSLWCGLVNEILAGNLAEAVDAAIYFILAIYQIEAVPFFYCDERFYRNMRDILELEFRFIISPEGNKYRKAFFSTHFITWIVCTLCTVGVLFVSGSYMLKCIVDMVMFYALGQEHGAKRPFTFPMNVPRGLDRHETPCYEILYLLQYCLILGFTQLFLPFLCLVILSLGHMVAQLDMVLSDVEVLFSELPGAQHQVEVHQVLRARVKRIVDRHDNAYNYLENLTAVYRKWFAYVQFNTTPVVCFTAYNFANSLDEKKFNHLMAMLCVGGTLQYFGVCLGITILGTKVRQVHEACGRCEWWNSGAEGRRVVRDLQMIMARAIRPLPVRVPGFKYHNLETFTKTMGTSYTYFNMLRQLD